MQFKVAIARTVQNNWSTLKIYRNSHTHLTETPSFAWYVAAALNYFRNLL